LNCGKITLLPDYIDPARMSKYKSRVEEWQDKVKLGKKSRAPSEIKGRPTWVIETKPHVGMHMKRIFPGITGSPDKMYYAHSPGAARDLEWFLQRYPMSVHPADALYAAAKGHRDRERVVAKLMALSQESIANLPCVELARPLWDNQKVGIELAHQRIAGLRASYLTGVAKDLVGRYDLIAHENLSIRNMVRSNLAKSIHDASWGKLIQRLNCEAEKAGKTIVAVNPRGTTINCSACGEKVPKTLSQRVHNCPSCGLILGRDHNAALNVLRLGESLVGAGNTLAPQN
jgi:IS605 OrfB family transposase